MFLKSSHQYDTMVQKYLPDKDPQDHTYHEYKLRNGTFVFHTDEDHRPTELCKAMNRSDTYRKEWSISLIGFGSVIPANGHLPSFTQWREQIDNGVQIGPSCPEG